MTTISSRGDSSEFGGVGSWNKLRLRRRRRRRRRDSREASGSQSLTGERHQHLVYRDGCELPFPPGRQTASQSARQGKASSRRSLTGNRGRPKGGGTPNAKQLFCMRMPYHRQNLRSVIRWKDPFTCDAMLLSLVWMALTV